MADNKRESCEVGDLTVKVSADVGDALTGFKALQRELRETTKAARELEQVYADLEEAIKVTEPVARKCGVTDVELFSALLGDRAKIKNDD